MITIRLELLLTLAVLTGALVNAQTKESGSVSESEISTSESDARQTRSLYGESGAGVLGGYGYGYGGLGGSQLNTVSTLQSVPVVSNVQTVQHVPVVSNVQTVQQVPVVSTVQQVQPVGVAGFGGGLLGGGGVGGIAGGGIGGGFHRYRETYTIRGRGFGGGLGGFGGLGAFGGLGSIGGGRFKVRYVKHEGGFGGGAFGGGLAGAGGFVG